MDPSTVQKKSEVAYLAEYFPGSLGYRGGGAERLLERLATRLGRQYRGVYTPTVYIGSDWTAIEGKEYPFETIVEADMVALIDLLCQKGSSGGILHVGSTFLAARFPALFKKLLQSWQGPVIQRITNVSKVETIQKAQGTNFTHFLSGVDIFISQSDTMTTKLRAAGLPSEKVVQIENGIDCDQKKPLALEDRSLLREKIFPKLKEADIAFLYAGRIYDASKQIEDLLRVWLEGRFYDSDAHLFLAGEYHVDDGSLQPHLQAFFKRFSSEMREAKHIHFLGLLPESVMEQYYQIADIYVSPSADEGFSNAMLEAAAFGLPLIGRSGVHGNEHLIHSNQTGFLFRDIEELSEIMQRFRTDTGFRTALGTQARVMVEEKYTLDTMLKKYITLYDTLLKKSDRLPVST